MFAAIRGYHRRRGWAAWHTAWLVRVEELPALPELTGDAAREIEESDEERDARLFRNSMAWAIVTGGHVPPEQEPE